MARNRVRHTTKSRPPARTAAQPPALLFPGAGNQWGNIPVERREWALSRMPGGLSYGDPEMFRDSAELQHAVETPPEDPKDRAQYYAYEAMEAHTLEDADRLAGLALELDRHCVDALVVKAFTGQHAPEEIPTRLRAAIKTGKRLLGEAFFRENAEELWKRMEARPYLRAKFTYARHMFASQELDEAHKHFIDLLKLNPRDHQGAREYMLSLILTGSPPEAIGAFLDYYGDDPGLLIQWGRVYYDLIRGDVEEARRDLRTAVERNPHVPRILRGEMPPGPLPDYYARRSPEEADHVVALLLLPLAVHKSHTGWIRAELAR